MSLGLYLHIPYCFSKCRYCDFYSHPGERGVPEAYVDALLRELDRFAPEAPLQPDTLYFGGGTPSLLRPEQAKRLIDAARPMPGAEITLEANPETVTEESLAGFREAGVNRISFGVQSARDTQLRTLGRPHTAKQARAAFAAARRAGFANISGDIMLALPHYTEAEFDETLELIEGGGATHISAYLLKIEPDSAFGKHPPEGLPTGDEAADFYLYAVEQLELHATHRERTKPEKQNRWISGTIILTWMIKTFSEITNHCCIQLQHATRADTSIIKKRNCHLQRWKMYTSGRFRQRRKDAC